VEVNELKESPADFALWKAAKPGEIAWDSPFGPGRPGWHIECSAMGRRYLGDTFDIHGGGHDLIFPHHENEIAQSEAVSGKPFANYWMHNGFLNINQEKMSKSLGNFLTVHDLVQRYSPRAIRFFLISAHYRNPLNFSDDLLEACQNGLERIDTCRENLVFRLQTAGACPDPAYQPGKFKDQFIRAMDDDFNTADGISAIYELVREANQYMREEQVDQATVQGYLDTLDELAAVLSIAGNTETELLDTEIENLIEERNQARKSKNYARADEIRNLLTRKGILLEDTPQGVRWRRESAQ
jgi:cysteinyl-tRNA synthetase